ncbi:Long-chain-fatty-acid--CoA ligase [Cupriavidus yeoncheonensis]|uniref:Long-chain-fatty-acid--CoA ligase n=1 Tax=Cupriavidus yeoncheonensis TaxID=1462994 RepID=A0A916ITN9_9BURK|nr:AMP-binding protein [Cupriavidus yeoncheonensis]CAG2132072.1 Long-chain-fatty-acid--CoA ligase [Cupriavidus yeoncheonensis]
MTTDLDDRPWYRHDPSYVPRTISPAAPMDLLTLLSAAFRKHADRPVASCQGDTLSFAELDRKSTAFAAWLQGAGLSQGDRVALMLPNSLPYLIGMVGALRAGLVVVAINPLYTPREVEHQLRDSGATCLLIWESSVAVLQDVLSRTAVRLVIPTALCGIVAAAGAAGENALQGSTSRSTLAGALREGLALRHAPVSVAPASLAFLQYTGGTTGVAKGAMLTHGSVCASLAQLRAWMDPILEGPDVSLVTPLPLYHVYPMAIALLCMACGVENRLVPNPREMDAMIAELSARPFEVLIGVNTLFNAMVAHPGLAHVDFSRTRLVTGAGASVQDAVANRWAAAGAPPITEGYGLTETSPSATFNPPGRNGSIGMPVPSTDVLVADDDGNPVPPGMPGELLIKGPQLFAGYWGRDEETRNAFHADGWFRTGDIVTMDEHGAMTIVDRKKDMILVSGFNVYPNEIEAVVARMEEVLECACVGVPDERSGEAPHLFVVVRNPQHVPAASRTAIQAHCRSNLAAYKVPRHITFLTALPKSTVGKVLRRELNSKCAQEGA